MYVGAVEIQPFFVTSKEKPDVRKKEILLPEGDPEEGSNL